MYRLCLPYNSLAQDSLRPDKQLTFPQNVAVHGAETIETVERRRLSPFFQWCGNSGPCRRNTIVFRPRLQGVPLRRSTQKAWHRITHMLQIYCQRVVFYGRSMTVVGVCDVIQQMVPNEEMQKLVLLECVTDYMEPPLPNVP